MASEGSFQALIQRLRAGDESAALQLMQEYESEIRRAVRVRLSDPRMRRVLDSSDICQSVFGNFFLRAAAGQFDLERPEQLVGLLATMARNRIRDHARREHAARRDRRRLAGGNSSVLNAAPDGGPAPSRIVAGRELMQQVRERFSDEERQLLDLRTEGREWAEIASDLGGSAEALRKRLARAIDRVALELGLD